MPYLAVGGGAGKLEFQLLETKRMRNRFIKIEMIIFVRRRDGVLCVSKYRGMLMDFSLMHLCHFFILLNFPGVLKVLKISAKC